MDTKLSRGRPKTGVDENYIILEEKGIAIRSSHGPDVRKACAFYILPKRYTTINTTSLLSTYDSRIHLGSASQSVLDSSEQTLSALLRNLCRPRRNSHTMQLDLSLLISLYIISLQCVFDHVSHLLPLLTLQDGNLTQSAKSIPQRLLSQPNTPLLCVFCKGQSEERVSGCDDGERVARELRVKDRAPLLVAETGLVVVEGEDQVLEFLLPRSGCGVRFWCIVWTEGLEFRFFCDISSSKSGCGFCRVLCFAEGLLEARRLRRKTDHMQGMMVCGFCIDKVMTSMMCM